MYLNLAHRSLLCRSFLPLALAVIICGNTSKASATVAQEDLQPTELKELGLRFPDLVRIPYEGQLAVVLSQLGQVDRSRFVPYIRLSVSSAFATKREFVVYVAQGLSWGYAEYGNVTLLNRSLLNLPANVLAFTLAHEWAHQVLGHASSLIKSPDGSYVFRKPSADSETEADSLAAAVLTHLGYDIPAIIAYARNSEPIVRAAPGAETHLPTSSQADTIDSTHQSYQDDFVRRFDELLRLSRSSNPRQVPELPGMLCYTSAVEYNVFSPFRPSLFCFEEVGNTANEASDRYRSTTARVKRTLGENWSEVVIQEYLKLAPGLGPTDPTTTFVNHRERLAMVEVQVQRDQRRGVYTVRIRLGKDPTGR